MTQQITAVNRDKIKHQSDRNHKERQRQRNMNGEKGCYIIRKNVAV